MNNSSAPAVRRRAGKPAPEDEENAAELKLGPEFGLVQFNSRGEEEELIALNQSEARILIRSALKERKRIMKPNGQFRKGVLSGDGVPAEDEDDYQLEGENDGHAHADDDDDDDNDEIAKAAIAAGANEVLKKTLDHLSIFARFRDAETCSAVEQILKNPDTQVLHPFERAQLGSLACDDADEAKTLIPSLASKMADAEIQTILNQLSRLETPY